MKLTRDVLESATTELLGGEPAAFSLDWLLHLITLTQHATDLLLNEIERRGELTYRREDGMLIVPYESNYQAPTLLTWPRA